MKPPVWPNQCRTIGQWPTLDKSDVQTDPQGSGTIYEYRIPNLTFGGADFRTLYAMCGDKVFMRKVKPQGAPAFQPPSKPGNPRL